MFFSEAILTRRGPLAKVWLAAHMERKLSKTQTLQTDIEQSVGAIMGQDAEVMALRLSGQLLLGVVRIYSRKAKYLLDDCNEALLKIKMAFRAGVVDMTEDQLAVNRNAITLQGGGLDIDTLLPDINWDVDFEDRPTQPQGKHIAQVADITLTTTDDFAFEFDGPGYGLDLGPTDGIGSQDYADLGLSFGDQDNDMSVEQGRDAAASNFTLHSNIVGRGAEDAHPDFLSNLSRHASPLTELPATPPPMPSELAAPPESALKPKKKPKEKKQIVDNVTELVDGPGAKVKRGRDAALGEPMTKDVSNILTEQRFLPQSPIVMRLLEIREDPLTHFLPTKITNYGAFFCAAPPGLAPELSELFVRPLNSAFPKRRGAGDGSPSKKRKLGDGQEDEIEQARRAESVVPSIMDDMRGGSVGPGLDFGDTTGLEMEDYQMDVPSFDMTGAEDAALGRFKSPALSRMSTPAVDGMPLGEGEESYADLTCSIAIFDERPQTQTQNQTQATEKEGEDPDASGYSKKTVKALGILRKELQPAARDKDQVRVLSFRRVSEKATRRAAASFFFELLVLGTRDCVELSQDGPYQNIEVQAKARLWERQQHHASLAPAVVSSSS